MHAHSTTGCAEQQFRDGRYTVICIGAARISGHPRTDSEWCIRHRAHNGMIGISLLKRGDGQPGNDGEHSRIYAEQVSRLTYCRCGCRRLYREDEHRNTGQKGFCPHLRMYAIFPREFVAAHRLVVGYADMGGRNRSALHKTRNQCLCHRTAADHANLNIITHGLYLFRKDMSSPRRCSSSE